MSRCGSCPIYEQKMGELYCEGNRGVEECTESLQNLYHGLTRHIKKLCEDCDFNPTVVGSNILKAEGYEVIQHLKGDISVRDRNGKLVYFSGLLDYEP